MDIRLPVLDSDGNCSYDVSTFDTGYKQPPLPPSSQQEEGGTSSTLSSSQSSWKTRGMIRTLKEDTLVRTLSSLDILTSFPKDSLMNYMMLCMLLSWISSLLVPGVVDSVDGSASGGSSSNGGNGMLLLWKVVKEQWLPWWNNGLFGINNGGNGDGSSSSIGVDAKMISLRLFTLHWIIMFIKGMAALLLSWLVKNVTSNSIIR
jgi:hypothetical protein